jgi:hypothetical protein
MRTTSSTLPALVLAAALAVSPSQSAAAQSRTASPVAAAFEVTPYAGYLIGGSLYDGPLGTSVGAAPAPLVGAQLGMRLAPSVSLVANVATGSSAVKAGIPILGGLTVANSRVVLYDAGLQLDLPMSTLSGTGFAPFIQGGLGGLRQEITQSFVTVTSTSLAANVGAGADVRVGSGVGIRLMAKDYIGRFDAQDATSFDIDTGTKHNLALSVGLRFSF